jgi:hypothetical protein
MTGWTGPRARTVDERRTAQRALGLALVALLHLLLLMALLQAVIHPSRPVAAAREIFLRFIPRPPQPPVVVPVPKAVAIPPRGGAPLRAIVPLAPVTPAPDLRGLGQSLFGCSPESLASASPQERSHCLSGLARPGDGAVPHDHTKDSERWANAIKERNAPPGQIPCTYIAETPVTAGVGGYKVPMVEMVCLHKLLSH